MKKINLKLMLGSAALLLSASAWGQAAQPSISNNKVTLTVKAGTGQNVRVTGQLSGKMTEDNGTYKWTSGTLNPGIYVYNISVNGALVTDRMNLYQIRNEGHQSNYIIIGNSIWSWDRNTPHGTVSQVWVNNDNNNRKRVLVYTPYDYWTNTTKTYPVLYVQHGKVANETGCFEHSLINRLMDKLISQKKCVPFIVVMPFWNASTQDLDNIVKPVIEKGYRVDKLKTYTDNLSGSKHDINAWGDHVQQLVPTLFK